jgi:hypothetical protein
MSKDFINNHKLLSISVFMNQFKNIRKKGKQYDQLSYLTIIMT